MKTTINLQDELIAENRKALAADQAVLAQQAALDAETDKLVNAALDRATADYETTKQKTLKTLGLHYKLAEAKQVRDKQSKWAHLPQERLFTKDAIKELCLKYNLRFLPTSYYKGALDSELPEKIEELRKANGGLLPGEKASGVVDPNAQKTDGYFGGGVTGSGTLLGTISLQEYARIMERRVIGSVRSWDHAIGSFSIAAPAESFTLQPRPIDPLLFCNLGDDQYYLVHKWGSDISWSRRWLKHWRPVLRVAFTVGTWSVLPIVGALVAKAFEVDAAGQGFFAMVGFGVGALIVLGALQSFDFLTRNSKTTNERNWDSPYTS